MSGFYLTDDWHERVVDMLKASGTHLGSLGRTHFYAMGGQAYGLRDDTVIEHGDYSAFMQKLRTSGIELTRPPKRVTLWNDGPMVHHENCLCGDCNHVNHHSFSVAIYDLDGFEADPNNEDALADWLRGQDPINRYWARSHETALRKAKARCEAEGWTTV